MLQDSHTHTQQPWENFKNVIKYQLMICYKWEQMVSRIRNIYWRNGKFIEEKKVKIIIWRINYFKSWCLRRERRIERSIIEEMFRNCFILYEKIHELLRIYNFNRGIPNFQQFLMLNNIWGFFCIINKKLCNLKINYHKRCVTIFLPILS